jgi:diguanylate cyclase (GGDEF)-like protein
MGGESSDETNVRRGIGEARGRGYLRADIAGRFASVLFGVIGVLALVRYPSAPGNTAHHAVLLAVGALGVVAALLGWIAPWSQILPRRAVGVELAAFALIALGNWADPNPWTYGALFGAVFVWIGLTQSMRATAWAIVPASIAYVAPLAVTGFPGAWWLGAVSTLSVSALLGLALSWAGEQLRQAESQGRRRLTGLESVLASTVELAQPLDPELVIDMTVQIGMQAFGADAVVLLGAANEPDALMVLQQRYWASAQPGMVLSFSASLATELVSGHAVAAPPGWLPDVPETGGEAQLVPLLNGEGLVGVLAVWWRWAVSEYGSRLDHDLASTFGRQAGSALERAYQFGKLQSATMIDPLTGLGNRRAADTLLAGMAPGDAVVMIDLDHFKRVNDELGHPAGDQALRDLGRFLAESLRDGDRVARYGGEEFIMFVRKIHPAAVESLLERLRMLWNERDPITTFSIGAAIHQEHIDPRVTLQTADIALYQAKDRGRDRVVVAA